MALYPSLRSLIASLCFCFLAFSLSAFGRPATFLQDFQVTWSDSHIRQIDGGRAIQLILDQNSGKYMYIKSWGQLIIFSNGLKKEVWFNWVVLTKHDKTMSGF